MEVEEGTKKMVIPGNKSENLHKTHALPNSHHRVPKIHRRGKIRYIRRAGSKSHSMDFDLFASAPRYSSNR